MDNHYYLGTNPECSPQNMIGIFNQNTERPPSSPPALNEDFVALLQQTQVRDQSGIFSYEAPHKIQPELVQVFWGSCLDSVKFRSRDEYSEVDPVRRNGTDMLPLYAIREYFWERSLERIYFDDVRVVDVPFSPMPLPDGRRSVFGII